MFINNKVTNDILGDFMMEGGNMDGGFTIINNKIFEDENLSIQEQSILIALISYYNENKGYSFPAYKQLKARCKINDNRTLNKNVNSLVVKGYLKKETLKGVGCKYYILKYTNIPSGEFHYVENSTTCKIPPTPSGEFHYHLVENSTTTNTNTNTNINIYDEDHKKEFEIVWNLYPRKEGKAKARTSYIKLRKKITMEELQRCVERYSNAVARAEKQFIKHGSTFFSSGYEDYLDINYIDTSKPVKKTIEQYLKEKF